MTAPKKDDKNVDAQPETTNGEILAQWRQLAILVQRALPSLDSDLRAGRMAHMYEAEGKLLEAIRNKISLDTLADFDLKKLTMLEGEKINGSILAAQAKFDGQVRVDWEVPKWRITRADLPKEKDGDSGWKNGAGVGAIVAGLGNLFEFPKD